jgi:glyoxylase-like metal-dependent hydrolase (beta-lactamase superfamily II)
MCPPARRLVAGEGSLAEAGRLVCHCLLVETPTALVLVDTGLGTADVRSPGARLGGVFTHLVRPALDPAEPAIVQLAARGLDPADVRHVVATHLDVDHAGGLADFPHAKVHVSAVELDAAQHPRTLFERHRYRPSHWAHGPDWAPRGGAGEAWHGFAGVEELIPGEPDVLLVPLVGHSRGHMGVAVRTDAGWLLHAGDAFYHRAQLDPRGRMPPLLGLFERLGQADGAARLANLARLQALAATGEVRVVCAHDPVMLDTLV